MRKPYQIWRDRRGRLSVLRIVTLLALLMPIAIAAHAYATEGFGARPLNDLIHRAGYWALMFLLAALAVTPLRRVARFSNLGDVRRMIGVAAFFYIAAHLGLYIADQMFDLAKVASEIALRLYLTIGFVAWLGLAALAATSTDKMVRRLGGSRWKRLHQLSYVIGVLALIHYFQQTKADVTVPILVAGIFGWLMAYRVVAKFQRNGELSSMMLLLLAVGVSAATFLGEAIGIGLYYGAPPLAILRSAFDFETAIRPGWIVLAAGVGVAALDLIRSYAAKARTRGVPRTAEQAKL
jgi:sulfoxide reductase heme-binding subunit YedZ